MSGVSSAEFILLLVIGLVVLGPKRLPEIANKIGGWIGQARRMTRMMRRQLEDELNLEDLPDIKSPTTTSDAPDTVDDTADVIDEHIPNEDDTYSALHDDAPAEAKPEHEKSV